MKIEKALPNIYHARFSTQGELAATFVRFQEYYESPQFRGKVFTLGQFRSWYQKEYGAWTYYSDWAGFNVPSYILDVFRSGLFDPLTPEEAYFLERFPASEEPYYIIGTYGATVDTNTMRHEVAHGLYCTASGYKEQVDKLLKVHRRSLKPLVKHLKCLGYHPDVWDDEAHAYLATDDGYLDDEGIKYNQALKNDLERLFKVWYIKA